MSNLEKGGTLSDHWLCLSVCVCVCVVAVALVVSVQQATVSKSAHAQSVNAAHGVPKENWKSY